MSGTKYENDIVISSRIRLARNLKGAKFPIKQTDDEAEAVLNKVKKSLECAGAVSEYGFKYIDVETLSELERVSYVENHYISRELGLHAHSGTFLSEDKTLSIMINEEDHIRIQSILPGFSIYEAYRQADKIDETIESGIKYAFSDKYGFLTGCPTNLGTGMRAGIMLHLPAFVMRGKISEIILMTGKFGLTVRGIYGEGSKALGDLFQISNQNSLGYDENEILDNLHYVCKEIIKLERNERENILNNENSAIKDKIMRAYGILTNAYMIDTSEAMAMLSLVKMGIDTGVTNRCATKDIDELIVRIQPANLMLGHGGECSETQRDIMRASLIKSVIS